MLRPETSASREELDALGGTVRELIEALVERRHGAEAVTDATTHVRLALDALITGELLPLGRSHPTEKDAPGPRIFGPVLGIANPIAPPVTLAAGERFASGTVRLGRAYEGPRGYAHGGVSALLLDEVTAKVPELDGVHRVTGTLEITYHRPVPLDVDLLVEGRFRSRKGRRIAVDGRICVAAEPEVSLVRAVALFVEIEGATGDPDRRGPALDVS